MTPSTQVLICETCGLAYTDERQHIDWHVDRHMQRLQRSAVACPCCGGAMQGVEQPALMAGRASTVLYTCADCRNTFDSRDLGSIDAARYGKAVAR